ncbi:RagB/SusD family nutrient uptake outer membrane protein [Chitinophaga sp. SYP-B3965]|uniref:RagB/SusD family nutrient uptake outer membrane protein n=1 Tax=Chitinophaga sp. SYP-B3965 TaxID=2663120 RepID=UPI0012996BD3|nr:RagB/SusD family nutrient uptake outer membrane protein [Chitinophaga sp. SYP-B3965]MRG47396.1 RagB/SusD family nutrient uptake outer membrane protein [Chitinophaga sp. SYP-B3965]
MKLYKYLFYITVLVLVSSCKKILTQEPKNSTYAEKFWKSARDCETATAGNYALLRSALAFRNGHYMYGDAVAKLYFTIDYNGDGLEGIQNGDYSFKYNVNDFGNWSRFFKVITMSNTILEKVPKISDEQLLEGDVANPGRFRNEILGQALFVRAYTYFEMTRIWGDVPLVTEYYDNPLTAPQLARSSKVDVMKQIEKDARDAAALLDWGYASNPSGAVVTANRGSAYALLAHLYMWRGTTLKAASGGTIEMKDINSADTAIDVLEQKGGYSLTDTAQYYKTFIGKSSEGIFELSMTEDYDEGSNTSIGMQFLRGREYVDYFGTYARMAVKKDYLNEHFPDNDTNDVRFKKNFDYRQDDRPLCRKYSNIVYRNPGAKVDAYTSNNMIIFRLADMKLLKAEIAIYKDEPQKAMDIINFFRVRNGTDEIVGIPDPEYLMYYYILERGKELYLEGHLFYDLVRTKTGSYMIGWLTDQRHAREGFYWPVDPRLFKGNKSLLQTTFWLGKI